VPFILPVLILLCNLRAFLKEKNMTVKAKILTVTRDVPMVTLLQKELNDGTYEIVNTECTGVYLRDVIRAETPDFIILDIIMPSLDGIGTCLQIRQWTQTPIMMLSTWDTQGSTVRGLNLGSDTYLTEAFGIDILKAKIRETLERTTAIDPFSCQHAAGMDSLMKNMRNSAQN
jgi:two-component system, OmpR family, KDP operon response regulator KdpE